MSVVRAILTILLILPPSSRTGRRVIFVRTGIIKTASTPSHTASRPLRRPVESPSAATPPRRSFGRWQRFNAAHGDGIGPEGLFVTRTGRRCRGLGLRCAGNVAGNADELITIEIRTVRGQHLVDNPPRVGILVVRLSRRPEGSREQGRLFLLRAHIHRACLSRGQTLQVTRRGHRLGSRSTPSVSRGEEYAERNGREQWVPSLSLSRMSSCGWNETVISR